MCEERICAFVHRPNNDDDLKREYTTFSLISVLAGALAWGILRAFFLQVQAHAIPCVWDSHKLLGRQANPRDDDETLNEIESRAQLSHNWNTR